MTSHMILLPILATQMAPLVSFNLKNFGLQFLLDTLSIILQDVNIDVTFARQGHVITSVNMLTYRALSKEEFYTPILCYA